MKKTRTTTAPPGAFTPLRNVRLYGSYEEQVSGRALASAGQPDPGNGRGERESRASLARRREQGAHTAKLQRAQTAMLEAQRRTRKLRQCGLPFAESAAQARALRAEYLKLTGGTERRTVQVAENSESGMVKVA